MEEQKRLKIGLFIDTFYPMVDGVIQVVDNYAKYLSEFCDVVVFAPKGRKRFKDNFPYKVERCKRLKVFFLDYDLPLPKLDIRFKKILNNSNLDIVHIHSPFSIGKIGIRYAKKHNIPCIATMHSQFKKDFYQATHSKVLTNFMLKKVVKVFNSTDENWAVNGEVGRIFYQDYKVNRTPMVMYNGTDMLPFEDKDYLEKLRQKYNIKKEEKVFLFVGRMNVLKNLVFLVKSLKILKDKNFKFKTLFVGTGVDEELIKKEIEKNKLLNDILMIGKITDRKELSAHYALADLFVFPSLYDCSSLVQIEASSQKTPTLFLKGAATADTITPEINGYLSENNEEEYANKIIEIFNNETKYKEVCEKAFEDLYLPWPKVVKKAYERYLQLIDKKKNHK